MEIRNDFKPIAIFIGSEEIKNDNGKIEFDVKLTDSLTKFKIFGIVTYGAEYFGIGESSVTASKPLSIRPSLPHFLNFGDSCSFSVVLENQLDKPLDVNLGVRTFSTLETVGENGLNKRI